MSLPSIPWGRSRGASRTIIVIDLDEDRVAAVDPMGPAAVIPGPRMGPRRGNPLVFVGVASLYRTRSCGPFESLDGKRRRPGEKMLARRIRGWGIRVPSNGLKSSCKFAA